jgi:hypothetical protein
MPILGIQNLDQITGRLEKMRTACSIEQRDKAMEAAGAVLHDALITATPTARAPGWGRKAHSPGLARRSVLNVSARPKEYGVTRRLIGYSKEAFYMLWVEMGHRIVSGGGLSRASGGSSHRRGSGGGNVVGQFQGRHFMKRVFDSNIGRAMDAARAYVKKQAGF